MSACLDYEYEICPNCGDLSTLDETSGWCAACTGEHNSNNGLCVDCGEPVPENHQRNLCWNCKEERWLKKYGDVVEYLMIRGLSFNKAKEMVAEAVRPVCIVCGGPIKGGTPGESLFCSTNLKCKKVRNKYRRLTSGGMPQDVAIIYALE